MSLGIILNVFPTFCLHTGLDYVSHEDILPYNSTDQVPIQHELFERFLSYDQTKGKKHKYFPFMQSKMKLKLILNLILRQFTIAVPPFISRETLRAWQEKNHPWLELSDVHRETTEHIRVTVIPFYMGMRVRIMTFFLIAVVCWL